MKLHVLSSLLICLNSSSKEYNRTIANTILLQIRIVQQCFLALNIKYKNHPILRELKGKIFFQNVEIFLYKKEEKC